LRVAAESEAVRLAREHEQTERENLALEQTHLASLNTAAALAAERARAEESAAQLAIVRADLRAQSQAAARVKTEERAMQPAQHERRPWAGMAAVIALVLVAGVWFGDFASEKEPMKETKAAPKPEPQPGNMPSQLRLDRDADGFAARVKNRGKR